MHETGVEILQMLKQISAYDNSSESRLGAGLEPKRCSVGILLLISIAP